MDNEKKWQHGQTILKCTLYWKYEEQDKVPFIFVDRTVQSPQTSLSSNNLIRIFFFLEINTFPRLEDNIVPIKGVFEVSANLHSFVSLLLLKT